MNEIYFEVDDDVVIKNTPAVQVGDNIYTTEGSIYRTEVVMTKEIFQECYKKWIESQAENEDKE